VQVRLREVTLCDILGWRGWQQGNSTKDDMCIFQVSKIENNSKFENN
jgi:hypothetical protein